MDKRRIEFLYWSDCPSHPQAWDRLQEVLAEEGIEAEIERIEVLADEEAARYGFHGSPTIRVDGVDVDEAGAGEMPVALACRVYKLEDGRFSPVPSKEMIRRAVNG
ncbi:MAG TPA: DUF2703 domain-containing protein [Anaerolineae bacterium]|nr:DUF2703 domain-containing protein [Anaerolineae bacterium]